MVDLQRWRSLPLGMVADARMGMHSRVLQVGMGVRVRVGMVLGRWHMLLLLLLMLLMLLLLMKVLLLLLQVLLLLLLLKLLLLLLLLLMVLFGESRIGQLLPSGWAGQDRFFIVGADVVHGSSNFDNRGQLKRRRS